jgi:hypothetical protein
MFYKLDPVIGTSVDLYADLPWSNFELTGNGVEGDIRESYEHMCRETQILAMLPHFVREHMVTGEAIPHCHFDDSKGIFTHITLHNPDQLEVIDAPFIKMDPLLEFRPDDKLRSVLTSNNPELVKLRERMPEELIRKLESQQNIALSPINTTFIPRKLHPYDTRGTSIISRMWRVLMLEDAYFNASLQTARRHAAPIKVAKLGNAATGFIPPPEQEKRLLELLAQAEMDPNAWLVYHYGIQFETVGTTDRALSIGREWETVERIKLIALGISKSFLTGEVTYASAAAGLQVFLQRLKAMRLYFEQKFLYPKFFRQVAEINGWVRPKPSEVSHRFRVKRSRRELLEDNAYITPKIVWDKTLDPQINTELIQAMASLEAIGVKFSKTSKMASVGYSFEEETKKIHREGEFEKRFKPQGAPAEAPSGGAPGGGGGGGGGMPPPPDLAGGEGGEAPPPVEAAPPPGAPAAGAPGTGEGSDIGPVASVWRPEDVESLGDIMRGVEASNDTWSRLASKATFKRARETADAEVMWESVQNFLIDDDYTDSDIGALRVAMEKTGVLRTPEQMARLEAVEASLTDRMSDVEFMKAVEGISTELGKLHGGTDKKVISSDTFLTGV